MMWIPLRGLFRSFERQGSEDNPVAISRVAEIALEEQVHLVPDAMEFVNVLPDRISGGDRQFTTRPMA